MGSFEVSIKSALFALVVWSMATDATPLSEDDVLMKHILELRFKLFSSTKKTFLKNDQDKNIKMRLCVLF